VVHMTGGDAHAAPLTFDEFYLAEYASLVGLAMNAGATWPQAEEAVGQAMEELYRRWDEIANPLAYACRAVRSNFVKAKVRDERRRQRVMTGGAATRDLVIEPGYSLWEDQELVQQLLSSLPPAQRTVLALTFDGYAPSEIAAVLGETPAAVRQNLRRARDRLKADPYVQATRRRQRARAKPQVDLAAPNDDLTVAPSEMTGGESA
jgi:RNA polymerase sigma factor (sigma-70 family)